MTSQALRATVHNTEHGVEIGASAETVYGLIADVTRWPTVFPPTVHSEQIERGARDERIRLWATANGAVKTWTSRRELDPDALRVRFRQDVSQHPVAAMGGEWIIARAGASRCVVRLLHDFQAVGDTTENVRWISAAVDRNSTAELASLKAAAENAKGRERLTTTFSDVVHVAGDRADVYDFVNEAGLWSERLPHVARVELTEEVAGLQVLDMDTRTADGSVHTTKSVRVCFPVDAIVYKQLLTPKLLSAHTGRWDFTERAGGGTTVTSTHTIVLIPEAIPSVLGPDATVEQAMKFVRDALGRNSTATMMAAKKYAEERRGSAA